MRADRKIGEISDGLPTNEHRFGQATHDGKPTKTEVLKNAGRKRSSRLSLCAG